MLDRASFPANLRHVRWPDHYETRWSWIATGLRRQRRAAIVALIAGWTPLLTALYVAVLFGLVGAVAGLFAGLNVANGGQGDPFSGAASATGDVGFVAGGAAGAAAGFLLVLGHTLTVAALTVAVSVLSGAVLAAGATGVWLAVEPWLLRTTRGYRRLAKQEAQLVEQPFALALQSMGLVSHPILLIEDSPVVNAGTSARAIVVSTGLLRTFGDDPEALTGVLCHELKHWLDGDFLAERFVAFCALPVVLLYSVGNAMRRCPGIIRQVGRLVMWPPKMLVTVVINPAVRSTGRDQEYEADAAAVVAGFGEGLARVLERGGFEPSRASWQQVVMATHPPTALRLEAIRDGLVEPALVPAPALSAV